MEKTLAIVDFDQLEEDTINEFKLLSQYPHPSDLFLYEVPNQSKCLAISNYLKQRVKQLTNIEPIQDQYANLWFDIPANDEKYSNGPTIALQAHIDMVFTYDADKFANEPDPMHTPIELVQEVINGQRVIHSKDYKTSIGADNCIGVATILALIQSKTVKHGPLRIIFSNCEENAMQGAMMIVEGHRANDGTLIPPTNPHIMQGVKYILSLDSVISKSVIVSCCGGVGSHYSQTYDVVSATLNNHFKLSVKGFVGGHSGWVPQRDFGNPVKAVNDVLVNLTKSFDIELVSYLTPGVIAYNVVGKEAQVEFTTNASFEEVNQAIDTMYQYHANPSSPSYWKDLKKENIKLDKLVDKPNKVLNIANSNKIIHLNDVLWYGYDKTAAKTGIKTSANVGPTVLVYGPTTNKFYFETSSYSRSDDEKKINQFKQDNMNAANQGGFNYLCDTQFHPWVRDKNTKWLELAKEAICSVLNCDKSEVFEWEEQAGYECSWWSYAIKNIEHNENGACVCTGVNVTDEHCVTETIYLDSIKGCMKVIIYLFDHSLNII